MSSPSSAPSQTALVAGIAAPIIYIIAVVSGAALRPEYSHIAHAISELIVAGAPNKWVLDSLFALYNVLVVAFAAGVLRRVQSVGRSNDRHSSGLIGSWALIGVGVAGLATLFFPMDPRMAASTADGMIHLVLAGLCSLLSILTLFLIGGWFRRQPGYGVLDRTSLVAGIVVLVTGAMAAYSAATGSPFIGLSERLTIGTYILWLGVTASVMIVAERRTNRRSVAPGEGVGK